MPEQQHQLPAKESSDWMTTTHWSVVRAAGDGNMPARRDALAKLCTAYWLPLYAYVRRRGHDEHDASDLTQDFFAKLLARNDFASLQPSQGRFRAFLLAAMNHFLANEWRKTRALKRGAGQAPISLNMDEAEQRIGSLADAEQTPECSFDRKWAEMVLERAARQLREEFMRDGREELFRELNPFLSAPADSGDYAAIAQRLQSTKSAIAKSVERMRRRYRDLVRTEIGQTVRTPGELDEEMRYLLSVLT